ncbi:alpha-tocopherol transfer protein-like isoform X2 [Nilaparvata lugens]|nr:alpha-tocopherol transfer protein-like isoform X2 [Nilaparvata lugens]
MYGAEVIEPNPAGKSAVYKEYGMTETGMKEDITQLKTWLSKQPHLPILSGENVDAWLENYLITCKNSLERAKDGLDIYFSLKSLIPEVFMNRDPLHPGIIKSTEVMALLFLPQPTPDNRRVLLFSHRCLSADHFDPVFAYRRITMMLDVLLQEGVDYSGIEVVVDTRRCCFAHITKYNPALLKRAFDLGLKGYPQRVHKIHMVNPWSMLETGVALFKQFMSKKLQERMIVHRKIEDLHTHIPKSILPSDLSGEGPSMEELNDAWQEKLISYRQWFLHNDTIKADESKRVGKCRFGQMEQTFGIQGSFRKIEVD